LLAPCRRSRNKRRRRKTCTGMRAGQIGRFARQRIRVIATASKTIPQGVELYCIRTVGLELDEKVISTAVTLPSGQAAIGQSRAVQGLVNVADSVNEPTQ